MYMYINLDICVQIYCRYTVYTCTMLHVHVMYIE